jgi:hypothetical protein
MSIKIDKYYNKPISSEIIGDNRLYVEAKIPQEYLSMIYVISDRKPKEIYLVQRMGLVFGRCTGENIQQVLPDEDDIKKDKYDTTIYKKYKAIMYGTDKNINLRRKNTESYFFPPCYELEAHAEFEGPDAKVSHFQIDCIVLEFNSMLGEKETVIRFVENTVGYPIM